MAGSYGRDGAAKLVLALRQHGITQKRLAEAVEKTPREPFVAPPYAESSWDNVELPIDCGQTQTRPVTVALMIEALDPQRDSHVLEIGAGSGYASAVLAKLSRRVYSLERYRTLVDRAKYSLDQLGVSRVEVRLGDGAEGWPEAAPFDRILVMASVETLPPALVKQLGVGGILVAPIDGPDGQSLVKFERQRDGRLVQTRIGTGTFTPLESGIAKVL